MLESGCSVWWSKTEKVEVAVGIKAWETCIKSEERQVANENNFPKSRDLASRNLIQRLWFSNKQKNSPGNTWVSAASSRPGLCTKFSTTAAFLIYSMQITIPHNILQKLMNWLTSSLHSIFTGWALFSLNLLVLTNILAGHSRQTGL